MRPADNHVSSRSPGISGLVLLLFLFLLLALLCSVQCVASAGVALCPADEEAMAAMRAADNVSVSYTRGIGYSFVNTANSVTIPFTPGIPYSFVNTGGNNISLGMVILPELGVAPEAYAVYARQIALYGYYAVIVENATVEHVVCAMMQSLHVEYWTLLGHGNNGGVVAARLAVTLQPKVKGLILLAAALPGDLDTQALNLLLIVIYGGKDTLVTPEMITKSFSHMAGDTSTLLFPNLGHFDFVHSKCKGNDLHPSCNRQGGLTSNDAVCIAQYLLYSLYYSQWEVASAKALSYGDNEKLTPGHNDSKPYPGDIHVKFTEFPIPGTSPQRVWWIFTPSQIRAGLIYYPGAAVDGRASFPPAFEIAARGHMVVIVQLPLRNAGINFADANIVLNSNISAFSVVPEDRWAIGGHSLGGLGASLYAGAYGNQVYAAVFHAGGWFINLTQSELPVLQMYGTLDDIFSGGYERYRYLYVDPPPKGFGPLVNLNTTEFIPIIGANHYQVGDYGYQAPDQIATISLEQQHTDFAEKTVSFLDNLLLKKKQHCVIKLGGSFFFVFFHKSIHLVLQWVASVYQKHQLF